MPTSDDSLDLPALDRPTFPELSWKGPLTGGDVGANLGRVPQAPGIYLWRRGLGISTTDTREPERLMAAIEEMVATPLMKVGEFKPGAGSFREEDGLRSAFLRFAGLTLGGGGVTAANLEEWRGLLSEPAARRRTFMFLKHTLLSFAPVIYVGESGQLRDRMSSHLLSSSPLRTRLSELEIDLDSCVLWYSVLEGVGKGTRQAIEQVVTELLVAPLTRRAG